MPNSRKGMGRQAHTCCPREEGSVHGHSLFDLDLLKDFFLSINLKNILSSGNYAFRSLFKESVRKMSKYAWTKMSSTALFIKAKKKKGMT